ncbi:hypothetical protein Bca52824_037450 [Brassica carinata]|uniref:Uncharacterized protein n=1 Tax=Brassica carinata TaxID=52824 RepID=A0A8X7S7S0_BRACI|nr:hypothetical protein Bca52824_037450 [Brassica carinata]
MQRCGCKVILRSFYNAQSPVTVSTLSFVDLCAVACFVLLLIPLAYVYVDSHTTKPNKVECDSTIFPYDVSCKNMSIAFPSVNAHTLAHPQIAKAWRALSSLSVNKTYLRPGITPLLMIVAPMAHILQREIHCESDI